MPALTEIESLFATDIQGFAVVKRKNNPLRSDALVHRSLGKIASIEPLESCLLASSLVRRARFPWDWPAIGLSESSILLGRLVAEHHGASRFVYSTRYPEPGMVPFDEPHSHAPAHYINIQALDGADRLCIIEDEITTGNTIMNLIRVLAASINELRRVHLIALKVMCSKKRLHEMKDSARLLGIKLTAGWLYREHRKDEDPLQVWANPDGGPGASFVSSSLPEWEKGRGRLEPLKPEEIERRYDFWRSRLTDIEIGSKVIAIGASESVDIAYEVARVCSERCPAYFHHLTISPWELPGQVFPRDDGPDLFLYNMNMPDASACYFLVYDQAGQKDQMEALGNRLRNSQNRVYLMRPGEKDAFFDEL